MINPVHLSKLDYIIQQRQAQYDDIVRLREYANGDQGVILTDDEKIRLVGDDGTGKPNRDVEFTLNVCKTCIDVEADRLEVRDITVSVPEDTIEDGSDPEGAAQQDNELTGKRLSSFVWRRWKQNRMDEGQRGAHQPAIRDGDAFAIVHYDKVAKQSRIALHQVYDGQTSGVDMFYVDNDPLQPLYAVKIWIAKDTQAVKVRRKNIYYEDRVEKWISDGTLTTAYADADWRPLRYGDDDYTDDLAEVDAINPSGSQTMATAEWWTETGTAPVYNAQGEHVSGGKPLGLPVFHFRHEHDGDAYGQSTIDCLVPGVQDSVNDSAMDVRVASKLSGYKIVTATGFDPNVSTLSVYPGAIIYNAEPDGAFGQLGETNLMQLLAVKDSFIKDAATLTATPLTYFNLSGVIPAEGTQQSLESALLAKSKRNQTSFGNTWEDIIRFMLKLEKTWGEDLKGYSPELLETIEINCEWEPAETRNERDQTEIAERHKALGVPDRFVWRKLGYTEDEIDQFAQEREETRGKTIGSLAEQITAMEAANAANNGANQQSESAGVAVGA